MAEYKLEARRMFCPMPVIRTQDKIRELKPGDILEVVSTDPGALNDIPAWCRINGHRVLDTWTQDDDVFVKIEVCEN